jgi:hypothetical protein
MSSYGGDGTSWLAPARELRPLQIVAEHVGDGTVVVEKVLQSLETHLRIASIDARAR